MNNGDSQEDFDQPISSHDQELTNLPDFVILLAKYKRIVYEQLYLATIQNQKAILVFFPFSTFLTI